MHVAKKTTIVIIFMVVLLVCIMHTVQADVWSVDSETDWNNAEDSSFNSTINTIGLSLNWSNWVNIFYNASTIYSGSINCGYIDVSGYDLAQFKADVYDGTSTPTYDGRVRFNNSTINYDLNSNTYGVWVTLSSNISLTNYSTSTMTVLEGGGRNWYIQGKNYTNDGLWNSSWHDFSVTNILNQVNFSVNSIGGGLTYKLDVSDDGATIKDSTGWTAISSTGDIIHTPVLDSARYMRIQFNLTRGSTPLIDSFDLLVSENATPNIVSTYPVDGTQGVSTSLSQINVTINDAEGDTFNWSIDTIPDVGNSSGFAASNGTKTCSITGLTGGTTYTVYVNVSDTAGNILNYSFDFTTFGSVVFWCYDETNPSVGIPFGLEITNSHFYVNYSLTNGANISISELPFGDDVVFVVNSTGYETRMYTYEISAVDDYNFTFYLPPSQDEETLRTTSKNYGGTGNLTLTLDCDPSTMVSVQGWNESLYGHWFEVPESNYTLTGNSLVVDDDFMDANTSLIKATYYCSNDEYASQYLLTVYGPIGEFGENPPVQNAKITVQRYINTTETYENVSSVLTDGNGNADMYLCPGILYKFIIEKTGYDTGTVNRIPTTGNNNLIFRIYPIGTEVDETDLPAYDSFWTDITITGRLYSNNTIQITYYDINSSTIDTNIMLYEYYNGTLTYLDSDTKTGNSNYNFWKSISNSSRDHILYLFFNTTADYNVSIPVHVYVVGVNKTWDTSIVKFDINERFGYIFGGSPVPVAETICILIGFILLVLFGPVHVGIGVISCGFAIELVQAIYGIWTTNVNLSLIAIGALIIFLGIMHTLSVRPEEKL